jgi:hypothetical protein
MDHTAFAAVHWVEREWLVRLKGTVGGRKRRHAEFLHAEQAIVVAVKRNPGVIFARDVKHLQSEHFQCQKQLTLVGQENIDVFSRELDLDIRMLKIRIEVDRRGHLEIEFKTRIADKRGQEIRDLLSVLLDRVLGFRHA